MDLANTHNFQVARIRDAARRLQYAIDRVADPEDATHEDVLKLAAIAKQIEDLHMRYEDVRLRFELRTGDFCVALCDTYAIAETLQEHLDDPTAATIVERWAY